MLRDFRPQLRPPRAPARSDIEVLCHKGDVAEALKAIRNSGLRHEDFAETLRSGMRKMMRSHRANEVLSILHKYPLDCPYSIAELLRATFSHGDMPGFLKQAHRFGVYEGFESEIEHAIAWLVDRKQSASAEAYRRKFGELSGGKTF